MDRKKIVIFGAGKIGRSFIGQLFSTNGFEVVFIDISEAIINALNQRGNYNVLIKSETGSVINVKNVRGVWVNNTSQVFDEVASTNLIAISVGQNGLKKIMELLSKCLTPRLDPQASKVDIIIAENLRNAADFLRSGLAEYNPAFETDTENIGYIETSIGKMVPIMKREDEEADILQVFAEPYNTLIVDKNAFKNPVPKIAGLAPKGNMKAWVDRKLFIHNLGHVATAYLGHIHNPKFIYLFEALAVAEVYTKVRETMLQSARILAKKYPEEFTLEQLTEHIDDLLFRFQNRALGDTIYRVGCDLFRKLGPDDRLSGAINLAIQMKMPYDKIAHVLLCGAEFRATDETGAMLDSDKQFFAIHQNGIEKVLSGICGFDQQICSKIIHYRFL